RIDFEIVQTLGGFNPDEGTVRRANVECPLCHSVIDDDTTRALFRAGKAGQRMVAVVLHHPQQTGKRYRLPTEDDLNAYRAAEQALATKREHLRHQWGIDPVPDELIPTPCHEVDRLPMYGMPRWGDVFNPRQLLALITFADLVRQYANAPAQDPDFAKAVATYLALAVDMMAAFCNSLARWENTSEAIKQVFSRQALPMLWDYAEVNPLSGSTGSWQNGTEYYLEVLTHLTQLAESLQEEARGRD
ncbi:MAG: hypothetical protein RMJ82_15585, partial [Gemmatales bacterium]|nr:hypothetical protein [Gemmatales bacterium]